MKAKYGEKPGLKNYDQEPSMWDGLLITKVEFWAYQYDFSMQLWGPGNNNVFINRANVELHSTGGFDDVQDMLKYICEWCEKANPRVKYPEAIIGKEIDLPD